MNWQDVEQIRKKWLNICGPCDAGVMDLPCIHPDEDPRTVIAKLCDELQHAWVPGGF